MGGHWDELDGPPENEELAEAYLPSAFIHAIRGSTIAESASAVSD